jgi:hypothetical protein
MERERLHTLIQTPTSKKSKNASSTRNDASTGLPVINARMPRLSRSWTSVAFVTIPSVLILLGCMNLWLGIVVHPSPSTSSSASTILYQTHDYQYHRTNNQHHHLHHDHHPQLNQQREEQQQQREHKEEEVVDQNAAVTQSESELIIRDSHLPHHHHYYQGRPPRPPLESIVQGWNVTGDVSWLLHFAIVGFPKCGTSSLMFHLQNHPQIQIHSDERCDMSFNQHVKLIRDLYHDFPADTGNNVTVTVANIDTNMTHEYEYEYPYRRGIKCPLDLENPQLAMPHYHEYFPATKFIVGIRHPVLW